MDVAALALKLRQLNSWIEAQEAQASFEVRQLRQVPFGSAEIGIDATATSPAASLNRNRIYLCGDGYGLSMDGLREIIALFEAKRIMRYFVWLSPGPNMEIVRDWLGSLGFERVVWTRYPTLLHLSEPEHSQSPGIEVREVSVDEVSRAHELLVEAMMNGYFSTAGKSGFHHYMAYDDGRPIAGAVLVQFENIGYLTYAGTMPSARRRGAQSALIRQRVEHARRLGCTQIASQTLTMLRDSFSNLQRAGFREVYEQEVYERVRG